MKYRTIFCIVFFILSTLAGTHTTAQKIYTKTLPNTNVWIRKLTFNNPNSSQLTDKLSTPSKPIYEFTFSSLPKYVYLSPGVNNTTINARFRSRYLFHIYCSPSISHCTYIPNPF